MSHRKFWIVGLLICSALLSRPVHGGDPVAYDAVDVLTQDTRDGKDGEEVAPAPKKPEKDGVPKDLGVVDVYSRLNVRSGPGIDHAILGKLYPGDELKILGERSGWLRIQYRGGTAWVCGFYVWKKGRGTRNPAIRDGIRSKYGDMTFKDRGTDVWAGEAAKSGGGSSSGSSSASSAGASGASESMPSGPRVGRRQADGGLDVPLYSQFNCGARVPSGFCGPTSVKMAMEYYGQKHHVNDCANGVYNPGSGASHGGMLNKVKSYGMRGSYMSWGKPISWLKEQTDKGYPVIVSVKGQYAPGKRSNCGHILCIVGVTSNGSVIINDSNGGVRRVAPAGMFRSAWHGGSGGGMAIVVKK